MPDSKSKECTFCDGIANSREHVVASCFFTDPKPSDLVTVPACDTCNNIRFSQQEEMFKAYLSLTIGTVGASKRKLWESARRGLGRKKRFRQEIVDTFSLAEVHSPSGLYIGKVPTAGWPQENFDSVMEKIVRGLFKHIKKEKLPLNTKIEVIRHESFDAELLGAMENKPILSMGGNQFVAKYGVDEDNIFNSMWLLQLHEQIFTSVFTFHKDMPRRKN